MIRRYVAVDRFNAFRASTGAAHIHWYRRSEHLDHAMIGRIAAPVIHDILLQTILSPSLGRPSGGVTSVRLLDYSWIARLRWHSSAASSSRLAVPVLFIAR
jgi:hypothetical protein